MKRAMSMEQKRDIVGRMLLDIESNAELRYVLDHSVQLQAMGLFEVAFVQAWSASSTNNCLFDADSLEWVLMNDCDRNELRAASDALPEGETFTIYRGVSGKGKFRRVRGLAWTADLHLACWFAMRYVDEDPRFIDPAVYKATVNHDEVLFFTDDRNEQEFVCRPQRYMRMPLCIEEIGRLADIHSERRRAASK